jgi:hypothetical protein
LTPDSLYVIVWEEAKHRNQPPLGVIVDTKVDVNKAENRAAFFRLSLVLTPFIFLGGIKLFGLDPHFFAAYASVALAMALGCLGFVVVLRREEMHFLPVIGWIAAAAAFAVVTKYSGTHPHWLAGFVLAATVLSLGSLGYGIKRRRPERMDILAIFCWACGTILLVLFACIFSS